MNRSRLVCALAAGLWLLHAAAHGEAVATSGPNKISSATGQFVVAGPGVKPWYYRPPDVSTNPEIIRLEAPLLAISAERFKVSLWRQLGLSPDSPWTGKIFLNLHPTISLNEEVVIASEPFLQTWNYRLELPDLISSNRLARAMSAVLLLEIANRNATVNRHATGIPSWLVDGLAHQIVALDGDQVILSAPTKSVASVAVTRAGPMPMPEGIMMSRMNVNRRGLDPLENARHVLQSAPALTFDQLSWPDNAQMNGADGGVYLASAQLFVTRLLDLPDGAAKLRNLLARLPACENWQTAFYAAFQKNFRRPLDVEKWWSLQVVNFANRDPGPRWTTAVGRQKLDTLLLVPVDIRYHANAWPVHTEISLQAALRQVNPQRLTEVLQIKLRDLDLAQLRLSPQLAALAAGYRATLADYLGEPRATAGRPSTPKRFKNRRGADVETTVKKLDALDAQRQKIEAVLRDKEVQLPGN
jgi:hypothetical protein